MDDVAPILSTSAVRASGGGRTTVERNAVLAPTLSRGLIRWVDGGASSSDDAQVQHESKMAALFDQEKLLVDSSAGLLVAMAMLGLDAEPACSSGCSSWSRCCKGRCDGNG